jgi:hypothetical protein
MKRQARHLIVVLAAGFAAFGAIAGAAAAAAAGEVIKSGVGWEAEGRVVARNADEIVLRTDDHGHRITFTVDGDTKLPDDLKVGSHVRIDYHPMGSTGQTADEVEMTEPSRGSR